MIEMATLFILSRSYFITDIERKVGVSQLTNLNLSGYARFYLSYLPSVPSSEMRMLVDVNFSRISWIDCMLHSGCISLWPRVREGLYNLGEGSLPLPRSLPRRCSFDYSIAAVWTRVVRLLVLIRRNGISGRPNRVSLRLPASGLLVRSANAGGLMPEEVFSRLRCRARLVAGIADLLVLDPALVWRIHGRGLAAKAELGGGLDVGRVVIRGAFSVTAVHL